MDTFLVFYGYLSIAFGWLYYIVVFSSLGVAVYTYLKGGDIYKVAERYVKSMLYLGLFDLAISAVYSAVMTVKWLV
jgi:hypothetical protein